VIRRLLGLSRPKRPYLAVCEYWVYLPEEKVAPQEVLLARMVRSNPFAREGEPPPIGPKEALLFSDIRLHIGLALRSKNPHNFRPDVLAEHVVPSKEALEGLAESCAFAKLRFLSEEPLEDRRHVQFMPYLAEAVAYYGKSVVLFDTVAERLILADELREALSQDPDAARPAMHVRAFWRRTEDGGVGETRGLMKVGVPDLETPESPAEHETAITSILGEACNRLWERGALVEDFRVTYFGDEFEVRIEERRKRPPRARIVRLQSQQGAIPR
jgi:hypothetical protein